MSLRPSMRFSPTSVTEKLVPLLLVVIVLGLLAVFVVIGLAVLGLTPGV